MSDTPRPLLCVTGGDGSGKSTQVARLAAHLQSRGLSMAPVTIWDPFLDPSFAAALPFTAPGEVYGYLKALSPVSRAHFLFHALHVALDLAAARRADVTVLNGYWYKYLATEVAHGGDEGTLRSLTAGFPVPDATVVLAVPPVVAAERKVLRSDYESGYGDAVGDFLAFQERSHTVLDALGMELNWTRVDGTAPEAAVTAAIVSALDARLPAAVR